MILHIPHSSREIGVHIELDNEQANLDHLTDIYVNELFNYWGCDIISFPLSRFVCDVERLEHNDPMEVKDQGIIYRKDIFGNDINRITPDENIMKMYRNHYTKLNVTTNKQLCYYEYVIIIDCHTFASNDPSDPHVCIGVDETHTPDILIKMAEKHLQKNGLTTDINYPYKGTIIPSIHHSNNNVKSMMIEINRNIYTKDLENIIDTLLEEISNYEWSIA